MYQAPQQPMHHRVTGVAGGGGGGGGVGGMGGMNGGAPNPGMGRGGGMGMSSSSSSSSSGPGPSINFSRSDIGLGPNQRTPNNMNETVEMIRTQTSKMEDALETLAQPLKPYVPAIGRFLIIVTFLEDTLRILTQWGEQLYYLHKHRHFPWGLSHIFLLLNVAVMLSGSVLIMGRRYTDYAVIGLLGVVISQSFGYGLIFDINFFLRNLSVIGGLLMVLSHSIDKKKSVFAGLPNISVSETDRRTYFQTAGRVLLIFLFIGFILKGDWSFARVLVSIFGFIACVMVAVGFKARLSAMFLVLILSVFNVAINNWWSVHAFHPQRDFLKYDFFQTLSIVGGLLLVNHMGAGSLSVDEKKKVY